VQRLDAAQVGEVLDQFKRARPNLYGLFLMDANRQTVAFAGLDPQPLRATPTIITAVDRALTLGEPGVSNKLTTPDTSMIALTMPVHPKASDDGLPIGVVGSLLSVDRLKDTVLPFVRGDTAIAIVAEGEIIAAQGSTLDDKTLSASLEQPAALAKSGKVGAQPYADPSGEEHLAAYAPVPGAGWAVLVTHPSPSAYAPNRMLLERGLLALGLATLATFALVVVLGEWIARPLRELTDQAAATIRNLDRRDQVRPKALPNRTARTQSPNDRLAPGPWQYPFVRRAGTVRARPHAEGLLRRRRTRTPAYVGEAVRD
jgi:hypothetical protein